MMLFAGQGEFAQRMREAARAYWRQALKAADGNVAAAARAAGVNRTHAYKLLHALNVEVEVRRHRGNWAQHGL